MNELANGYDQQQGMLDHIRTKISNLEDKVRSGEIAAVDILSRLDYIAGCVEDLQS